MDIPDGTLVWVRNSDPKNQSRHVDGLQAIVIEQSGNPEMKTIHFPYNSVGYYHRDKTGKDWPNCWGTETEDLVVDSEYIIDKVLNKYLQ